MKSGKNLRSSVKVFKQLKREQRGSDYDRSKRKELYAKPNFGMTIEELLMSQAVITGCAAVRNTDEEVEIITNILSSETAEPAC